jgi:hypothetical protein
VAGGALARLALSFSMDEPAKSTIGRCPFCGERGGLPWSEFLPTKGRENVVVCGNCGGDSRVSLGSRTLGLLITIAVAVAVSIPPIHFLRSPAYRAFRWIVFPAFVAGYLLSGVVNRAVAVLEPIRTGREKGRLERGLTARRHGSRPTRR